MDDIEVVDEPQERRFVADVEGERAVLDYRIRNGRIVLIHTGVPDALSGGGVGGRLVRAALERAQRDGLTIVPKCPFARRWLERHEDDLDGVTVDWQAKG